jgi:hypothetical protein
MGNMVLLARVNLICLALGKGGARPNALNPISVELAAALREFPPLTAARRLNMHRRTLQRILAKRSARCPRRSPQSRNKPGGLPAAGLFRVAKASGPQSTPRVRGWRAH